MKFKSTLISILILSIVLFVFALPVSADSTEAIIIPNARMKAGFSQKITFRNENNAKIAIKFKNSKIAKRTGKIITKNGQTTFTVKALKKGTTLCNVFSGGKKLTSTKIVVYTANATLKNNCKNITLKHNSHGSNVYMEGCHIDTQELIKYIHPKGKYTAESNNHDIVSHTNDGLIYTVNKGTARLTIYEKIGNAEKCKLGTVSVTVKDTNMAYVVNENMKFYPDGIFGKGNKYEVIHLGNEYSYFKMQKRITDCLINNIFTGSSFDNSEYKITYKSLNKKVASVNKYGKVKGITEGFTKIRYTITFSDKSVYKSICHINVQNTVVS